MGYLLDTNIVSYFLKQNQKLGLKISNIGRNGQFIAISGVTY